MIQRLTILILAALALSFNVGAQSMSEIKKQKKETQKEIKEATTELKQNKSKTRKSLNALNRLSADIEGQEKSIVSLQKQVDSINIAIGLINKKIEKTDSALNRLKSNYLTAIKKMRSHRSSSNAMMFIFSSESFHQAYRRMRYLKEFSAWREKQTQHIRQVQEELNREKQQLKDFQDDKNDAIAKVNSTKLALEGKRSEQSKLI